MRQKLCLVANDVLGVITNSGIATATTHLALVLASRGYEVTVLNTGHAQVMDPAWAARYDEAGVAVEHLDRSAPVSPGYLQESYLTYHHLAGRSFDSIVFQDWLGPAFASVCAKRSRIAFESTQLVIVTHGPSDWVREANRDLRFTHSDLAVSHMERVALEGADLVVGPSSYLHGWMQRQGWLLGERRSPVPYFTAGHVADITGLEDFRRTRHAPESSEPIRELVFFGRLEHRKGILLYAQALNRLDPELLGGITLSFLGREATYTKTDVLALLTRAVLGAVVRIEFHTNLDQEGAREYLHQPGRVAVIPSLDDNSPNTVYESLEDRVPFIAANTGGIPELVDGSDHDLCLFEATPAAMAAFLSELLSSRDRNVTARPAFDAASSLAAWEEILGHDNAPPAPLPDTPLVSVIVPHHDRPDDVIVTLESLEQQDYPNLEVVLVDDGSATEEAQRALKLFEERDWRHPVRVVRQSNAFLGAARNTGVRDARADILIFIDDDDVAAPNYVSAMVTALQATGAAAVSCAFRMFEEETGPPGKVVRTWAFLGGNLPLTVMANHTGGAGVIFHRSAWEAVGGYHEIHGLGLEDWDILVRMMMAGLEVRTIPEALYWYRLRPTSMRMTMDRYHSHQLIIDRFRQHLPEDLRVYADLLHGQALALDHPAGEVAARDELDRRLRYQWLLERRLELLEEELSHLRRTGASGG